MSAQPSLGPNRLGLNRTGVMSSPMETKELLEAEEALSPIFEGEPADFVDIKMQSIAEADPLGSVPPPAFSLKAP